MPYDPSKTHAVHGALQDLVDTASSSQFTALNEELDEHRRWQVQRILYVAKEAARRTKLARGNRANLATFQNITNAAQSTSQELKNYLSNRNIGHIDNALNNLDQGLAIFVEQLPQGNANAALDTEFAALTSQVDVAVKNVAAKRSEALNRLDELSKKIEAQDSSLEESSNLISETEETIKNTLTSIETRFGEMTKAFDERLQERIANADKKFSAQIARFSNRGDENLKDLEKKKTDASAIVQSVGDILTTGTYLDTADKEAKLANTFRLVTIALFTIGILIVVSNYFLHALASYQGRVFDESPWILLSRFATALAVALPAFYTARESARHRTNADRARQRALELLTLGPFIELLPATKKNEIRDRLTDRYFNGDVEPHEVQPPITIDQVAKLFDSAGKVIPKPVG